MAVIYVSTLVLNVYSLNFRKREIRYWNSGNRTCHAKINSKNNLVTEVADEHTSATKHISFCQVCQAIQACNCKFIRFESVRWHDDEFSEHTQVV